MCGGNLEFSETHARAARYIYCGASYAIEHEQVVELSGISGRSSGHVKGTKVVSLIMLAEECRKEGKENEAERYYSRVIEIDPSNIEAWIGRGLVRFAPGCFDRAIGFAADKDAVCERIIYELLWREREWDYGSLRIP
jgi:hypothetical protein